MSKDNTNPSVQVETEGKLPSNKKRQPKAKKEDNIIDNKVELIKQYQREKNFAVQLRQQKMNNWMKNEEQYNGVIQRTLLTRSNLHVPVVFEGVQNMSAKLGQTPEFEYDTIPEGDENAAEIMKHVVKEDLDASDWETIYEGSKVEAGIYGRTIYKVIPGNDANAVELVDTLAYLISPIAKNTRSALYQGQQFIYKTFEQLEKEADEFEYDKEELRKLKENKIPNETQQDSSSEASYKNTRLANMGLSNTTNYGSKVAECTEWWTYLPDEKDMPVLYCLFVANDLYLLRKQKASDMGLKRPPFISWGVFTRGITFWCPSIADVYRDPNLAIDCNINQVIDNNTYRNFGMIYVSSSSGLKQSSIVPRPLGVTQVQVAPNSSLKDHIYQPEVPEITSALTTMQTIKGLADSAAGLGNTASSQKGKQSATQQAKQAAELEQKTTVMKRNATLAFQELTQLMADITSEKLTKPRQVKIFGYKNLTVEGVTKKNFADVKLVSKATPSEDANANKAIKQKAKADLYELFKDDPKVPGQLALRRSVAKTYDVPPTEIESWFTQEDQSQQTANSSPEASQASPQGETAPTEVTPILSQTGKEAQAVVPRAIR